MSAPAKQFAGLIRVSQPGDEAQMAELSRQLGYPSTGEEIARRLVGFAGSAEHAVFVAQLADGTLGGWIGVFVYRSVEADARAEISGLVVDESARSQGVGGLLLGRAEEWAREKGCEVIGLRSNVIRERAHAFYERHGYENVKTSKTFRKDL